MRAEAKAVATSGVRSGGAVLRASLALALASAGCSEGRLNEPFGAQLGGACALQEDCPPGVACLDGFCVAGGGGPAPEGRRCYVDAECDAPDECIGGVCRPPGTEAPAPRKDPNAAGAAAPGEAAGGGGAPDDDVGEQDPGPGAGGGADGGEGGDGGGDGGGGGDAGGGDGDDGGGGAGDGGGGGAGAPCIPDPMEPNDAAARATPIAADGRIDGLTVCDGDTDLFALDLQAGGAFSATVHNAAGGGAGGLSVELLQADAATVAARSRQTADGARAALAALPEAGRHYVRVTSADPPAAYGLEIVGIDNGGPPPVGDIGGDGDGGGGGGGDPGPCEEDILEPNDGFATATPVGPGVIPFLQICDGNPDLFALELAAGQTLSASIGFDFTEVDLDLALHGPDTELLSLSDGLLWSETVTARAEQDGWHFVAVFPFDFVGSGGYFITFDVQ